LADDFTNPLRQPLPDGIVSEEAITRTENRWVVIMLAMLATMLAVIVVTGVTHALNPPSNVETIDPPRCISAVNSPKATSGRRRSPMVRSRPGSSRSSTRSFRNAWLCPRIHR